MKLSAFTLATFATQRRRAVTMIFQSVLLLALSFQFGPSDARISNRRLSFERIVGYQPTTQVTDHAAIDLDQQAMEDQLSSGDHVKAKNIYE